MRYRLAVLIALCLATASAFAQTRNAKLMNVSTFAVSGDPIVISNEIYPIVLPTSGQGVIKINRLSGEIELNAAVRERYLETWDGLEKEAAR